MSLSLTKRTAPLSLLCCGVKNGGGAIGVRAPVPTLPQKREEELDGYMEEADGRTVKSGIHEIELPGESRLQLQDHESEKRLRPDLEMETRELLRQFYRSYTGLPVSYSTKRHSALPSLQRVVENLLCKHRIAYSGEFTTLKWCLKCIIQFKKFVRVCGPPSILYYREANTLT